MLLSELVGGAHYGNQGWPDWVDENGLNCLVPIVQSKNDIAVLVAGGEGGHPSWMAGWGVTLMKTGEIIR